MTDCTPLVVVADLNPALQWTATPNKPHISSIAVGAYKNMFVGNDSNHVIIEFLFAKTVHDVLWVIRVTGSTVHATS